MEYSAVVPRTNEGCLVRCWERYHRRREIWYVGVACVLLRPVNAVVVVAFERTQRQDHDRALLLASRPWHLPSVPAHITFYLLRVTSLIRSANFARTTTNVKREILTQQIVPILYRSVNI